MFFKTLIVLGAAAVVYVAPARASVVTAHAVHDYISRKWNVDIPYDENMRGGLVNMKYLMQAVDATNEVLNNVKTSNYAADTNYASTALAATDVAKESIDTLVKKWDFGFWVVPEGGSTFKMNIASAGTFFIAWGDGTVQEFTKGVGPQDYSHTYVDGDASAHKVYVGGEVTAHATTENGAIWFGMDGYKVREVGGCIGCVFHTIGDGREAWQQPKFYETFMDNTMLTSVPAGFFDGLHGGGYRMFYKTFNASRLMEIPEKLFGDSQLTTESNMFQDTFNGCSQLKEIPADLFAGLSGAPALGMFSGTFSGCKNLTGSIPGELFAGIAGKPASSMFGNTFANCSNLSGSIPGNLFAGIKGASAEGMFRATFANCSNLSGSIPGDLFAGIKAPLTPSTFRETFSGCSNLSGSIPSNLFAGISGSSAANSFNSTFRGCSGLTSIPEDLFGDISSSTATAGLFYQTFYGCTGLTGPSARVGKPGARQYLYERWPDTSADGGMLSPSSGCYNNATGLTDYACIPTNWGGAGTKEPGTCETAATVNR